MMKDVDIAKNATLLPIDVIAKRIGLDIDELEHYGRYKAKYAARVEENAPKGQLFLVTAMTPTPAGEGKTTISIALADGLSGLDKRCIVALREPSLGPVFGMKGGAAGGGFAQVLPMQDINLHFTGDLHAITAANNLLSALIDKHIFYGNALNIDPSKVNWRRCSDINDRGLREIITGLGGRANGVLRESGYDITVASEVMAILCLSKDLADLKRRLARIVVAQTYDGQFVTAGQLKASGAMATLLSDAIKPNLVQTIEGTPVFIHGGPFANIAHGCSSLCATRLALAHADVVVTEAGFGADLGAQKFIDIKCRALGQAPNAICLVATLRAIAYHARKMASQADVSDAELDLSPGLENLERHLDNLQKLWKAPVVIAINSFTDDHPKHLETLKAWCEARHQPYAFCNAWAKGGRIGAKDLAQAMLDVAVKDPKQTFTYDSTDSLRTKIERVAKQVYRAEAVTFEAGVLTKLAQYEAAGYGQLDVCIAKTQYSFSDNPKLYGAPNGFSVNVRDVKLSAGAGFVVAMMGKIMTMPGLGANSAAESIDISDDGEITGLF